MERPAAALDAHRRGLEIWERLVRDHPSVPEYLINLAATRRSLAELEMRQGRWQDARKRSADAVQAAQQLAALARGNPNDLYNAACILALSVPLTRGKQREELGAQAVQVLREAIAAGWRDAAHTSRDPDLIPLHDRDDFRRLLAELLDEGFPADPFAHPD
jgi:hypothetical protein